MNISLTWASYALIVSVCLVVYYLIFVLLFYRKGFGSLTATKEVEPSSESYKLSSNNHLSDRKSNLNLFGEEVDEEELKLVSERDELTHDAQDFADEIGAYTSSCGEVDKDELIANLRKIILKYPHLYATDYRYELNQLIAMSLENNCSIHLSADELGALWK